MKTYVIKSYGELFYELKTSRTGISKLIAVGPYWSPSYQGTIICSVHDKNEKMLLEVNGKSIEVDFCDAYYLTLLLTQVIGSPKITKYRKQRNK